MENEEQYKEGWLISCFLFRILHSSFFILNCCQTASGVSSFKLESTRLARLKSLRSVYSLGTAMQRIPALLAAVTPLYVSSITTHCVGVSPNFAAAVRNASGCGFACW